MRVKEIISKKLHNIEGKDWLTTKIKEKIDSLHHGWCVGDQGNFDDIQVISIGDFSQALIVKILCTATIHEQV
jgi:hypothetical protein